MRPRNTYPRLCRVRVLLCSQKCHTCEHHEYSEVLDAERTDDEHVRVTQRHPVWFGTVLRRKEFVFVEESE